MASIISYGGIAAAGMQVDWAWVTRFNEVIRRQSAVSNAGASLV